MIKILEGDNPFLSKQKLNLLLTEIKEKDSQTNILIINADNASASEIIQAYQTLDLFNNKKIVVLKRLMKNKEYKEIVENIYTEKEKMDEIDIIIWEGDKIKKNTRYYKLFNKEKCIESFPKFNKRTFVTWAKEKIKIENMKIQQEALENLILISNYDPEYFLNELKKFKIIDKTEITTEDLKKFSYNIQDYDIWEFIDSINKENNKKNTIKILEKFSEKRIEPSYVIVMLARNLKQVILVNKLLEGNNNDKEIVSILKIPPFTLPRIKSVAQNNTYNKLRSLYQKIYNLDYEIKTGNINGELGLLLLTTKF